MVVGPVVADGSSVALGSADESVVIVYSYTAVKPDMPFDTIKCNGAISAVKLR